MIILVLKMCHIALAKVYESNSTESSTFHDDTEDAKKTCRMKKFSAPSIKKEEVSENLNYN